MEIILLERIDKLGKVGDKVTVKQGYARNYLLPQKKALRATKENLAYYEAQKAHIEAHNQKLQEEAVGLAKKMEKLTIDMVRQAAETGQLYGSVTGRDIKDAIVEKGFKISRQQVDLHVAIKNIGTYDILLKLHPDVSQTIKVNIGRSLDEAKRLGKDEKEAKKEADKVAKEEEKIAKKAEKSFEKAEKKAEKETGE